MKNEEYNPYKPLSKRSKFAKPNKEGQIPKDCVKFSFLGKHCFDFNENKDIIESDCVVLNGCFCKNYIQSIR